MSHSSSRVKDQSAIARRKSVRKRVQKQAGVPVVVAKIRGEYVRQDSAISEKTLRFGERNGITGNEFRSELAKLHPGLLPAFRVGMTVRHKIRGSVGKLVRRVESGSDTGKWFVRWDGTKTNAGPYVERNLVIV